MNTSRNPIVRFLNNPIFQLLKKYVIRQKNTFFIAILCSVLVAITGLMPALAGKLLIKGMDTKSRLYVNYAILVLVGSYAVRWIFVYGQTVLYTEASQQMTLNMRRDIYSHLHSLSLKFFNKQRTGALMSTLNNDVPILQSTVAGLKDVAPAPFMVIGGLIASWHFSPALTLAAAVTVPVMSYAINRLNRQIKRYTADTQAKVSDVNVLMEETLSGIRIIQSFSAEATEIARFQSESEKAKSLFMKSVRRQAQLKPTIDLVGSVGVGFALWVGAAFALTGSLKSDDLIAFIFSMNQVAVGLSNLGSGRATWEQASGAGERILENILDVKSEIVDKADAVALDKTEGHIEFRDVCFAYNPDNPVLNGVNFEMKPGEVVAVVGASGAGKSTLSDLIPRFYDPDSGAVLVDGHDVRDVKLKSLRKHIGIVPQETMLFGGTIRDNIVYGNPSASDDMVIAAAKAANAHEFITDARMLPDGYNTIVGERGKQLSGGQRQRISIARALLKNPKILILDEATSSLDAKSEILVQEALDELMQGRTTLVIAHRLSTIINAHKIIVLENGRVKECGSHSELIKIPNGIYARLYETQYRNEPESQVV